MANKFGFIKSFLGLHTIFPYTKAQAVSTDDGNNVQNVLNKCVKVDAVTPYDGSVPVDADKLGGKLPSEYALEKDAQVIIPRTRLTAVGNTYTVNEPLDDVKFINFEVLDNSRTQALGTFTVNGHVLPQYVYINNADSGFKVVLYLRGSNVYALGTSWQANGCYIEAYGYR